MGFGIGRLARGSADAAKPQNPWKSFLRVLPWLKPYWGVLVFGLSCLILTSFLAQQPPRLLQRLVDNVLTAGRFHDIPHYVLLFVGVFLGSRLFGFLRTFFLHVAGQNLMHSLRVRMYGHFQKQSLTYYDNRQTGDLMSRMTGDVGEIENLMVHGLDVLLRDVFGTLLAFYYMYGYNRTLAFMVLIPVPVLAIGTYVFSSRIRSIYRAIRDRIGDLNAKLQENISGIRVIKAFNRENSEMEQVTDGSEHVRVMNCRGILMWSSFGPAMEFMSNIGILTVLGMGAYLVARGQLKVGELMAFYMYVGSFYQPVTSVFQFFNSIQRSLAAGDRIFEVLDSEPEIQDPELPVPLGAIRGEVAFEHVRFCYSTGEEVLHDVSVTAQPGERIALVGRSGAGKSSFINLIPRFYDVAEGRVTVDGTDVRQVLQSDLRQHIALVLQETFLFNGTVRENLRYGKLDATDADIEEAAKAANAHEFIARLQHGYDTEIGERGVKLSGGQRQRLAIARAVLADPRILILDEATSSVDSESEYLIHQALERLMEGRTTFIIAHRLSTIRNADTILVLEDGSIVERGAHAELLRADGRYAQMYRQQFWLDELYAEEDEDAMARPRERFVLPPTPDADMPAMG